MLKFIQIRQEKWEWRLRQQSIGFQIVLSHSLFSGKLKQGLQRVKQEAIAQVDRNDRFAENGGLTEIGGSTEIGRYTEIHELTQISRLTEISELTEIGRLIEIGGLTEIGPSG